MEWASFAIALTFNGVSPVEVDDWDEDTIRDAMAVISELNRDARAKARRRRS